MQKQLNRSITRTILIALTFCCPLQTTHAFSQPTKIAGAITAAASLCIGAYLISTPKQPSPTIASIRPVSGTLCSDTTAQEIASDYLVPTPHGPFILQEGLQACTENKQEPVWILASGWKPLSDQFFTSRMHASYVGLRRYLKRNIFHGPSITFIYNDDLRSFNFGQELDQQSLHTLYEQTTDHACVLYGLCRGAKTILGWLEHFENNKTIKAVILESPALSLTEISYDYGKNKAPVLSCNGALFPSLAKKCFPNYRSNQETILNDIATLHLDETTPLFIGHIQGDPMTTDEKVTLLVNTLRTKQSNPLYFFVTHEKLEHGMLSRSVAYQQALNAFLKKYGLPHDATLAEQGVKLLEKALHTISVEQEPIAKVF